MSPRSKGRFSGNAPKELNDDYDLVRLGSALEKVRLGHVMITRRSGGSAAVESIQGTKKKADFYFAHFDESVC